MKFKLYIFQLMFVFSCCVINAQESTPAYQETYNKIDSMLSGTTLLSFKKAVFNTESAYFDGKLNSEQINQEI